MKRLKVVAVLIVGVLVHGRPAMAQREIPSVAAAVADDVVASGKKTIAVVDFTDLQANVTELGRFVAEEMALGLVTARKGLSVVDRTHLRVLMQENKLDAAGVIDPTTARKLGQILGVEALVTGTITPFADTVRVVVKVLDTTTARIVSASSADMSKNPTIEELLKRDIRPALGSSAPANPTGPEAPRANNREPAFQNGAMRVTVGQLGVSGDNRRASVSLVVENVSKERIYVALARGRGTGDINLADDQGTQWIKDEYSGIPMLPVYSDRSNESAFAAVEPGGRMTVVLTFFSRSGIGSTPRSTPGKVFSVSASAVQYTPSGQRPLAIGIAGISPTSSGR